MFIFKKTHLTLLPSEVWSLLGPALSCIQPVLKNSSIRHYTQDFNYELLDENRLSILFSALIQTKLGILGSV